MIRRRSLVAILLATLPASAGLAQSAPSATGTAPADALAAGFADPPAAARPRVWWHWMNGNVTKDGIRKDLEWMKRIGIGGVQNFDASISTPQIVGRRLVYMTPEWKDAFRYAATLADQLGLELGIASSPGFSETGGPWVRPADAMKKLVWSETPVAGGRRFAGALAALPTATGPFQSMPKPADMIGAALKGPLPVDHGEIAAFAYPVAGPLPAPRVSSATGEAVDAAALADGRVVTVAVGAQGRPAALMLDYGAPRTVRSATILVPGVKPLFGDAPVRAQLAASDDGATWRDVAPIALDAIPTTVSFAPVTARRFRVSFVPIAVQPMTMGEPIPGAINPFFAMKASSPTSFRIAELRLSGDPRVDRFEAKAGFSMVPDYYALHANARAGETGVAPGRVIDLTGRVRPDGTLDWTPPAGDWRIVRIGWSLLGTTNHPATPEATGLEVDKFDGAAVRRYLETYLSLYRDAVGPDLIGRRGVRALVTDSTEVGPANWTPRMIARFEALRGYDPTPWLPALTGVLIGTRAQSDAFLYDYRRTLADLIASDHYGTIATVAHEQGLRVYGEALEDNRPSLGDDMAMRAHADVPMAAMWTYGRATGPKLTYLADDKGASSVGHLYGRAAIAAESMTSIFAPWAYGPADLRRVIDLEFALGINLPVIHTSVHQPVDDKVPGLSLFSAGQFFTRHESWAEMAGPWIDYIARNGFLLRQGRNVADVAYFYGEEAPLTGLYGSARVADAPVRYAYDHVDVDALATLLSVDRGDLVAPGGARYRVLYLGGSSGRMTLATLRRVARLAEAGATIVGDAPAGSPSLDDGAPAYRAIVARLWPGSGEARVGKGRVIAGRDIEAALAAVGVRPDFAYARPQPDSEILFVHRALADGDLYYLDNRQNRPETIDGRFRVAGKAAELCRADTGRCEPASFRTDGQDTIVPLAFGPEESFFVVFRKPATAASVTVPAAAFAPVATLDGSWVVAFQPGRGAPPSITVPALGSLSEQPDKGVRYFSGVATYTKNFELPRDARPGAPLVLDLGRVGVIAEVRVNGRLVGTAWHAPYRLDIGTAVKPGTNRLDVRVADLWVNRLIGDAQPGATKIAYTSFPTYRADAPLRPSGLIGPVTLLEKR